MEVKIPDGFSRDVEMVAALQGVLRHPNFSDLSMEQKMLALKWLRDVARIDGSVCFHARGITEHCEACGRINGSEL